MTCVTISCASLEAKPRFFKEIFDHIKNKVVKVEHKAPRFQIWEKCQSKDVRLHGKSFDYKEHFCYRWCSKRSRSKPYACKTWQVKPYHMVKDHDIMVQRGLWFSGDSL